jgi:hypothetical protein
LTTGAKIAIGCGFVLLLTGVAAVVGVVGFGYWAKGKVEEVAGDQDKINRLNEQANANPFTQPADGVIAEDRLVTFLAVRRQVFASYEKHRPALEAMKNKKQADFSDVRAGLTVLNDLRLATAQALVDHKMSEGEYEYLVQQVYKSMAASEMDKARPSPLPSPVPGASPLPEMPDFTSDVPKANVELFRKHEAEIRKYAMGGLELIGL